jgi:hypothetical protein
LKIICCNFAAKSKNQGVFMKKIVLVTSLLASAAFASPETNGYCNATEACPVISENYKVAQNFCNQYLMSVLAVTQKQSDGSTKFVGYVCVTFSGN